MTRFNPQIISVVYKRGRKNGTESSSNIKSKSHNKAMFITIVKSPSEINSNGIDNPFRTGFRK